MIFRGAIIVLAATIFFGVASTWVPKEHKRVANVVESFYTAYNSQQYDAAINLMRSKSNLELKETIRQYRSASGEMHFRILDIQIKGEDALVTVSHSDKSAKQLQLNWRLKRNNQETWEIINLPQPSISLPDPNEPDSEKVFQNIYLGLGNRSLL